VAPPEPVEVWSEELRRLPPGQILLEFGKFAVIEARAGQIPVALREVGRLREVSFRAEGEGSGRSIDLDHFDDYYIHLILWNREECEIIGAYRLGPTDEILPRLGIAGLYTQTCFAYDSSLTEYICPALELGRSFVRPDAQKAYTALPLLWKGIGRFILKNPQYRVLFGAVSISQDYSQEARELITAYLERSHLRPDLAKLVHPRSPFALAPVEGPEARSMAAAPCDVDELSKLVEDLEGGRKGVPILLKHYLKLGAEILAFNVDHDFGDCLDALIRVDLTKTPLRTLERFMGREEAATFLALHQLEPWQAATPMPAPEDAPQESFDDFWESLGLDPTLAPSESL
jgi:putative hemolysin